MVLEKKLFKTALGKKYVTRLEQIIYGTEDSYSCVLCGKDLDNSTLVCSRCLEKYRLLVPGQAAEVRREAESYKATEVNEAAAEARELAEAREIMTARNAKEAKRIAANLDAAEARGAAAIFREIEENGLTVSGERSVPTTDAAVSIQTEETSKPSAPANSKFMGFFTGLFQEHTNEEAAEIFIAGTAKTTPLEYGQTDVQPKPWLFMRIFVALMLTFGFLYICAAQLKNFNTISGLLFLGAAVLPLSILTLMYETNTPKNISMFDVIKMFFAGSATALLLTTITFNVFPIGQLSYSGAVIVGFIEESVKLLVIIIFIKLIDPKYILNGLLIGAAVGAGFSVFESTGYAFRFYLLNGGNIDYLTDIILLRAWSSLGSHTIWSAIAGGGLLAAKTDKPFSFKFLYNPGFLSNFIVSLIFHSVWNCPFMDSGNNVYIKLIVLIILAWTILLSLLRSGIRQFKRVCYKMHVDREGTAA
ncbi:MAG: PrsW family intramembrane metalloprotease [Lachnospiraceae bacterium]|nr:PrsW family intramembrane metalloprotease [Lachnospiraceae bacterium]